jgi:hypothetical protein
MRLETYHIGAWRYGVVEAGTRMAGVPPIAAISLHCHELAVCAICGPLRRSKTVLLDDLVGGREQIGRHGDAQRLRSLEIDDQLYFGGLLDRQIGRLVARQGGPQAFRWSARREAGSGKSDAVSVTISHWKKRQTFLNAFASWFRKIT